MLGRACPWPLQYCTYIYVLYTSTQTCNIYLYIHVHTRTHIFSSLVESHFYYSEYFHLSLLFLALKGFEAGGSCIVSIFLLLSHNPVSFYTIRHVSGGESFIFLYLVMVCVSFPSLLLLQFPCPNIYMS